MPWAQVGCSQGLLPGSWHLSQQRTAKEGLRVSSRAEGAERGKAGGSGEAGGEPS